MARSQFLTNYAEVLVCIDHDPDIRLRDVCEIVGITERAARRIVAELVEDGYVSVEKNGRRNFYTVQPDLPLHDPLGRDQTVGQLLDILVGED